MKPYHAPAQFESVSVETRANSYFGGKVVSRALTLPDGSRKTLGVIFPGTYKFDTAAPERMEIVAGCCRVRIANDGDWIGFTADTWFDVPADSFFEIEVEEGTAEYICSYK